MLPKVVPAVGVSKEECAKQRALLARLTVANHESVKVDVKKLWDQEMQESPPYMQRFMPQDPPITFWEKHY